MHNICYSIFDQHKGSSNHINAKSYSNDINKLCSANGFPINRSLEVLNIKHASWNGVVLRAKGMPNTNIIHDLAHFIVASEERKFLPDYGLGLGPDSYAISERVVADKESEDEESLASVLGILIEYQFGANTYGTLYEHSWTDHGVSAFRHVVKKLNRMGHLQILKEVGIAGKNL